MILVDSSVWIDFFNGRRSQETDRLQALLGNEPIAIGDLMLTEVLQGFRDDGDYSTALSALGSFEVIEIGGSLAAMQAAANYRALRKRGITVRKTIDTLIATRCIMDGHRLLYSDRDFDPFVKHLGLLSALKA